MTVVTTRDAGLRPLGLTVNAFCSVSLDPPLVLICVDRSSEAHAGFRDSGVFGVSVLAEGQEDWSRRFALAGPDKFVGVALEAGKYGVTLVPGALAHLECRVIAAHDGGDHVIYLGEVVVLQVGAAGRPLLFHASSYRSLAAGEGPAADDAGADARDRV